MSTPESLAISQFAQRDGNFRMIALSTPLPAPSGNDVVSLFQLLQERWNLRRVVLQVAIHGQNKIALGMVETRGQRRGLPEIAAQLDDQDTAVDRRNLLQQLVAAVRGTIIHEHQLKAVAHLLHDRLQLVIESGDILFFIVKGDDDGIFRHNSISIDPITTVYPNVIGKKSALLSLPLDLLGQYRRGLLAGCAVHVMMRHQPNARSHGARDHSALLQPGDHRVMVAAAAS